VSLDLSRYIKKGDAVVWTQTTAEPLTLTEAFVAQRQALGPCAVFIGATYSNTLQPEHQDFLKLSTFGGFGFNHRLIDTHALEVIPLHCSEVGNMITKGVIPCDVAMLQLSPPGPDGKHSLGISADYMIEAARRARIVIAEVNEKMPWTPTSSMIEDISIHVKISSNRPLLELPAARIGEIEMKIASIASTFIPDRAVLELGLGAIPEAILGLLVDRRDLGIHTGVLGDAAIELVQQGVITNAFKSLDTGKIVTASLLGTQKLYDFGRANIGLALKPYAYTHALHNLARLENFTALNSAIEVDLTGQVNAESINGRYVGASGGLVDFVRGALVAPKGRSIIALPSTTKDGTVSRIVSQIKNGPVTCLRSDADIVVTEWGAAELRGKSLTARIQAMIAIAHPDHRETLEREVRNAL
jgi:acetyl-CoA hydrolase